MEDPNSIPRSESLTAQQGTFMPDAKDVTFFQEHGWWMSPVCLNDALLDDVCYGTERYYLGERDWPLMVNVGTDWTSEKVNRVRTSDYLSLQMEEFRRLVHSSVLAGIAARLAGTSAIRLFHDQFLCKSPGNVNSGTAIGWHTDKSYWPTCS